MSKKYYGVGIYKQRVFIVMAESEKDAINKAYGESECSDWDSNDSQLLYVDSKVDPAKEKDIE